MEEVRVRIGPHWAEGVKRAPPGGVWVGVWFSSRLYYPFSKGPGQHIIWCLENKKCENEDQAALNPPFFVKKKNCLWSFVRVQVS